MAPSFTFPGTYAVLRTGRKDFCYLVARPLIFAGLFLNGEYIPSRNVLDLEKQSAIFLISKLGMDWIFKQINQETVEHTDGECAECTDRKWGTG